MTRERWEELAKAKKWPDARHLPLRACVPGSWPAVAHSAGRGSFWVGIWTSAGVVWASRLQPSWPCGPAWFRGWRSRCAQGVRFPTADSCPELGPELSHQLSYNLRAKIEPGFSPDPGPGRMGTGPPGPTSEDARTGLNPDFNPPWLQATPKPQLSVLGAPLPSHMPGSQDLGIGREGEQEAPGTPLTPTLPHQTDRDTKTQTRLRAAKGDPV